MSVDVKWQRLSHMSLFQILSLCVSLSLSLSFIVSVCVLGSDNTIELVLMHMHGRARMTGTKCDGRAPDVFFSPGFTLVHPCLCLTYKTFSCVCVCVCVCVCPSFLSISHAFIANFNAEPSPHSFFLTLLPLKQFLYQLCQILSPRFIPRIEFCGSSTWSQPSESNGAE